ncbi:hypothetical protein EMIHUDRAFT_357026 [Emiliania huxleyi CCMP1516]|uniref:Uncharacterized protein n=2 Tax=Emiliania huxleyi TaxID=2903 RepID=A0A0D3IQS1_EMIH1|nr:hypothetical protein EMIHUDRAFT_357026 [Emiliania huxleyi CCMP1516]EOD13606.1 hypothetical protein EMIHUDRAFT_357026 [Emiliania huxleyi CCMP1516]|eukprot:XP_005766035.1 hypothetical protein EMIHUDRAFT_357026 [Emiliania huxleyi CCMP1516]
MARKSSVTCGSRRPKFKRRGSARATRSSLTSFFPTARRPGRISRASSRCGSSCRSSPKDWRHRQWSSSGPRHPQRRSTLRAWRGHLRTWPATSASSASCCRRRRTRSALRPRGKETLEAESVDASSRLETPKYRVLRSWRAGPGALDGVVELRSYPPFTVARKGMGGAGFGAVEGGGAGFNALASYLFGDNAGADGAAMAMTTPVGIDVSGGGAASSMSFVLPRDAARAPPRPNADGGVALDEVPARIVAVKAFAGVVTDGEVRRQRDALEAAIEADGGTAPARRPSRREPFRCCSLVLQYNAPYAIPWRRRNELAIVVSEVVAEEEAASAGEAAAGDAEAAPAGEAAGEREGREGVSSWYDTGVRL